MSETDWAEKRAREILDLLIGDTAPVYEELLAAVTAALLEASKRTVEAPKDFEELWEDSTSWQCSEKERMRLTWDAAIASAPKLVLPDWLRYHACMTCESKLLQEIARLNPRAEGDEK